MEICSSAKKWDEGREGSGLAELADSKIPGHGMSCASCLLQDREETQEEEEDREQRTLLVWIREPSQPSGEQGGVPGTGAQSSRDSVSPAMGTIPVPCVRDHSGELWQAERPPGVGGSGAQGSPSSGLAPSLSAPLGLGQGTARAGIGLYPHPRGAQNIPGKKGEFLLIWVPVLFLPEGEAVAGPCLTPPFLRACSCACPFTLFSHDTFLSSPGQRHWVPSVLGTGFCHFMLNFPGSPKHWEQAGPRGLSLSRSSLPGGTRSPVRADR